MAVPTVQITGAVVTPDGTAPTSGTVTVQLSQAGSVLDGATSKRVAGAQVFDLGAGGACPAEMVLVPNDAITPSGTYYAVRFRTVSDDGVVQTWSEKWQIASSPATIDVGAVPRLGVIPGVTVAPVPLSGDLGGSSASPQVVATHLGSPLPQAQGGTGAASLDAANVARVSGDLAGAPSAPQVTQTHLGSPLPESQGGTGAATLGQGTVTATGGTTARTIADHLATLPDAMITPTGSAVPRSLPDIAGDAASAISLAVAQTRQSLASRVGNATVADVRLVPFEVTSTTTYNRVSGYVGVAETGVAGALVEIAIYNSAFAQVATTGVREWPPVGEFEFALPETTLQRGLYYLGIATNGANIQFGVNPYAGAVSALSGATITAATPATTGGTLADGFWYYEVTALGSWGETSAANKVMASLWGGGGSGSVALTWTAVTGATGYRVYRSISGSATVYLAPGNVTSFTDTGAAGTTGTAPKMIPLPATATANSAATQVAPALSLWRKAVPAVQGLFSYTAPVAGAVRVYGGTGTFGTNQSIWGWNVDGKMVVTTDGGQTWGVRMPMPRFSDFGHPSENLEDVIDDGSNLYALGSELTVLKSSSRLSDATWSDISCPTTPGLRHSQAIGRPYGMAIWNGYLFIGEYSGAATGEFAPDGPRILRRNQSTGTWSLSMEFAGARHVHSFFDQGDGSGLWVSVGDAGYSNIGIHRLTAAGIGAGVGGSDSWQAWTNPSAPHTDYYPVDFIVIAGTKSYGGQTPPDGIYATSDRPGKHVLYAKTSGSIGQFNLSAQIFEPPGGDAGETVRSLAYDSDTGNLYWWTAETTHQALWVSPPPYTQALKLHEYPASPTLFLCRAFYQNGWILMYQERFHVEKFVGQ